MNLSKKMKNSKPHLFIQVSDYSETPEGQKDSTFKNQVALKPLRSAKNLHELRKFNFDDEQVDEANACRQLRRLRKLQEEKVNLMQSLQILKASAVSAIAEKEDQIQHLREREDYDNDEEFYERELERGKKIRQQLEEEREQLHREMHLERKKYIVELEERENLIDRLYQEIQEVRRQLSMLEDYNEAKTKKIKLLQEENSRLSDQLELSSIASTLRDRIQIQKESVIDLDETIKIQPALSATSSIPCKSYASYVDSDHYFQTEADRSYMTEKLEEVEKIHKEQLLDLKSFYEKRIQGLRQIYERELHLPTQESQRGATRSRRDSQTSTPVMNKNSSKKQLDSALHLNLKDMYSIQESVENQLQTSRTKMLNLRHEIKMQNLSQCPSLEPKIFNINDDADAESQFTTKYFDVNNRFLLKRNRSNDTFNTIQEQESKTMIKTSTTVEEPSAKAEVGEKKESFLKKSCIFAAGLISGATITSVLGYFLKKR